jgi:hypothetical protein
MHVQMKFPLTGLDGRSLAIALYHRGWYGGGGGGVPGGVVGGVDGSDTTVKPVDSFERFSGKNVSSVVTVVTPAELVETATTWT